MTPTATHAAPATAPPAPAPADDGWTVVVVGAGFAGLSAARRLANRPGTRVEAIDAGGVQVAGEWGEAETVFWAAGVQAAPLAFAQPVETDRAGRIVVGPDLSIPGHPEVFVAGDMAAVRLPGGGALPGVATAAMQAGRHVADAVRRDRRGRPRAAFAYRDKGQMATIGRHRAIVAAGPLRLTGGPAWVAWLFVHVYYLIGFKNRFTVFWQWAWTYLFAQRGARIITEREWRLDAPRPRDRAEAAGGAPPARALAD